MKNKFITTVVATALALTMTFSLANGMDVKAAEITEDSLVAAEDTNVGILVNAITHDMMLDTPIRKMMIPVISALSRRIFGSSLILIDLYTNNDRSRLYTTATTEPSVAVKIPKMIPPITITIRSRQGRA